MEKSTKYAGVDLFASPSNNPMLTMQGALNDEQCVWLKTISEHKIVSLGLKQRSWRNKTEPCDSGKGCSSHHQEISQYACTLKNISPDRIRSLDENPGKCNFF